MFFGPILTKLEFCRQLLTSFPGIKFREDSSSGSGVLADKRPHMAKLTSRMHLQTFDVSHLRAKGRREGGEVNLQPPDL